MSNNDVEETFLEYQQKEHIADLEEELDLYKRRLDWLLDQFWVEDEICFRLNIDKSDDSVVYKSMVFEAIDRNMPIRKNNV
jgi:hypothetical protein